MKSFLPILKKPSLFILVILLCQQTNLLIYERSPKNIVFIMIDTLRADHLGAYGYKRNTSPNIDQFANQNFIARRAYSVANWTPPAVASMFTGLSIENHGHYPDEKINPYGKIVSDTLDNDLTTLAEILKSKNYSTAAAFTNVWITHKFNFHQGFDSFFSHKQGPFIAAQDAIKSFSQNPDKPFFLYLHILDTHAPYRPPAPYKYKFRGSVPGEWTYSSTIQPQVNRYDEEINYVDDRIKELFDYLKSSGLYDNTLILIVSDHGEQFGERGFFAHGKTLYNEEIKIPFIIKCPAKELINSPAEYFFAKYFNDKLVSNMDVTPTILDCLDISVSNEFDGESFFKNSFFSDRKTLRSLVRKKMRQEALITNDNFKIIKNSKFDESSQKDIDEYFIYDLVSDRLEANPIKDPELLKTLSLLQNQDNLIKADRHKNNKNRITVSEQDIQTMKSLGYLND